MFDIAKLYFLYWICDYSPGLAASHDTVDDLIQSALVSPGALTLGSVD